MALYQSGTMEVQVWCVAAHVFVCMPTETHDPEREEEVISEDNDPRYNPQFPMWLQLQNDFVVELYKT